MATSIEMILRPNPSNWLGRLQSIKGQMSLAVEQDYSLIKVKLVPRENFRALASLNEVKAFPSRLKRIMEECPETQISVTLNHPERTLRHRRQSLTILELFATFDRYFITAWLSEMIEMRLK